MEKWTRNRKNKADVCRGKAIISICNINRMAWTSYDSFPGLCFI